MRKLSKAIYNNNIGDRHAVKALALFVFVKENKPTSVFTDYTITALAEFASLSRNTTRDRIKKLEEMGLVEMSAEQKELQPLFEDIQVLVNWALDRLPLAAPPKENEVQSPEEESTSEPK